MEQKSMSAGVVVVMRDAQSYHYLLLRAYQHWDFPKGMVEAGEQPFDAALREVREESTICDLEFPWGKEFLDTGPYGRGKVARYYLGLTHQRQVDLPINPEIGRPEHEEYRWVSYQEAKKLVTPRVRTVLEWANQRLSFN